MLNNTRALLKLVAWAFVYYTVVCAIAYAFILYMGNEAQVITSTTKGG
jgi:hypothetical protein